MLKIESYNRLGVKGPDITLPKEFSQVVNMPLLSQAIHVLVARSHSKVAKVKTRAEINRTKKKVYRQKGTGGARHGARSAPIYVGGGIAHGPKGVKRLLSLPYNMRIRAINEALALKASLKDMIAIENPSLFKKTKEVVEWLKKTGLLDKKATFILQETGAFLRTAGNIENLKALPYKNLDAKSILFGGKIIIDKAIFEPEKPKKTSKK